MFSIPPMRNILFMLSFASVLLLTGCGEERQSMKVTQDKGGHAYIPEGAGSGSALGNVRVAGEGEKYITTGAKDTLTSIAKQYNTTVEWLIKRNDLKAGLPAPGTNLIVPDPNAKR
jgi:LysM repeat protein